jgi:hypothetical protein
LACRKQLRPSPLSDPRRQSSKCVEAVVESLSTCQYGLPEGGTSCNCLRPRRLALLAQSGTCRDFRRSVKGRDGIAVGHARCEQFSVCREQPDGRRAPALRRLTLHADYFDAARLGAVEPRPQTALGRRDGFVRCSEVRGPVSAVPLIPVVASLREVGELADTGGVVAVEANDAARYEVSQCCTFKVNIA